MPRKPDYFDFTTMLEEAQLYYDTQIRSFEVLRDNAKTTLTVSSVLVSLFATFGVQKQIAISSMWYGIALISIAVLYGWLMVKCLAAVSPGSIYHPITPTDKSYAESYLNKNEIDIIKQKLSNYLNVIPKNEEIIGKRKELGIFITIQLAVIVILILITSVMQLYI